MLYLISKKYEAYRIYLKKGIFNYQYKHILYKE